MKHYLFNLLFCCSVSFGFSQNTAKIDFVISNFGIDVDGHFNSISVMTKFNKANSELETISGLIEVSSIETGIDSRDEHLLEADYFNAETYKLITLKSESVTKVSDGQYKVKVNLKIKGITKQITIRVTVLETNGSRKTSSTFEIDRKDFKVGGSSFVMSKTVKINVIHYQKL
jgi:polyisoprenoid-binding protein YceI